MLRIEPRNRIEGGGGEAGDAEGIEDMHGSEPIARFCGDDRIFSLGIDAEDGTIKGEEVRDDRPHALAGTRRCHGQEMRGTGIAQERPGIRIAADQKAGWFAARGNRSAFVAKRAEPWLSLTTSQPMAEGLDHGWNAARSRKARPIRVHRY